MRHFLIIIFILLSVSSHNVLAAQDINCLQHHCVAVVDAGSTGSRIHIYSYDVDNNNTPIHISEEWNKKIKPGFATIEANQATVDAYLTTLLTNSPSSSLPIYFYATAGMRLLPSSKQAQLYSLVQNWFKNQTEWTLKEAKTIPGSEEGLYGWLAINYQLETLANSNKQPVGVMDMGGASVQIIFSTSNNEQIASRDLQQLDLYGRHFTLFIHSFLGLGATEVTHQYLDSTACFANNYQLPDGSLAAGNAQECELEVTSLMNDVHHVNQTVQPAIAQNPVQEWYALGGAVELVNSKPFNFSTNFTNQSLLQQGEDEICHQQWSSLASQYPANEYLYQYCLFSAYYYALMVEGYGISPQQEINFMPTGQNNDWTIGVVLHPK